MIDMLIILPLSCVKIYYKKWAVLIDFQDGPPVTVKDAIKQFFIAKLPAFPAVHF
jgi:hypothetical protein